MESPFWVERDGPRALTDRELQRLVRNGFPELAVRLSTERCKVCGHSQSGAFHAVECRRWPEEQRQPWDARPMRHAA